MKKYYLAYGSNLNLLQMKARCKKAVPIGTSLLTNYRLVYKGSAPSYAYLTIEECEGSYVPVGIYEITYYDELSLDRYEGYPEFYEKCYVPITINDREEEALIYIMNEFFNYNLPSKNYVDVCKAGYHDFGFDTSVLDKALLDTLENFKSRSK